MAGSAPLPVPFAAPARLLAIAAVNGVDLSRLHVFAALLARYIAFEPLRIAERLLYDPAIDRHTPSEDPIFVLGHWRSGTTLLQELLALDPRLATTTLYGTLFADAWRVGNGWLEPLLTGFARLLALPHSLQRQRLRLDLPGEHDVGLCAQLSPHAYTWGHLFPRRFEAWLERCVLDPSPEQAEGWLADLDRYLRKLSRGTGRRLVLKSPGDTGRLDLLAARWPDARFVFLRRDPVALFHSNRYLWGVIRREFSLQTVNDEWVDATILASGRALLSRYLVARERLSPNRLVELAYEDLLIDPRGELERLYGRLELGELPAETLRSLADTPPRAARCYETSPELEARVRDAWGFASEALA